ncbi:MAG TPA: hypothetical protein VFY87_02520 [Geminicoccaceae bacterium]|nr:hypothetical protein [Geminicoccaceae bacterium]
MSDFVGEDLASGQALEGTFVKYFAHLFLVDEYGHRLAAALNPKGNPNEKRIVDVITKLSTSGAGPYTQTRMAVHRDCDCPVHLTWDPCLVMFNTTVEEPLWGGMGSGHVNDGSMARHLFFKSGNDYPDNVRGVPHFEKRLPEMVERAERVIGASQGNVALFSHIASLKACYTEPDKKGSRTRLQPLEPQLITLPVDADAAAELDCLSDEQTVMLRQADSCGALIGRMVEHATRLALICAVSESPEAPTMTARHVLWGEAVAKWSLDTALRAAAEHVADTPHQANRNKLLRDVRRVSKGGWVTARDVTRASTWSNSRDRGLLLFELVDLGLVEKRPAPRVSGQATSEYRCRS